VAELPVRLTPTTRAAEPAPEPLTVFAAAGGQGFFDALAAAFYRHVAADPVLLALYPEPDDLAPAERRLALFLGQYWGGPTTYSDERGHPRLRMRHAPFVIGPDERDRWLAAMRSALDELAPPAALRARFEEYFDMAAEAMRNQDATGTG
jgi:hemoglobin